MQMFIEKGESDGNETCGGKDSEANGRPRTESIRGRDADSLHKTFTLLIGKPIEFWECSVQFVARYAHADPKE